MTNQIGNGSIPLRIGNLINTKVYGGPYRDFGSWEHIPGMFGVKMAVEIDAPCHVSVPTRDYDVPKVTDLQAGITRALMAMVNDQPVYVGCMGGIGRTGLFLAALAKVQIEYRKSNHRQGRGDDPVLFVRNHFIPHAVETDQQQEYIDDLDVSMIVTWLKVTQQAMGLNTNFQTKLSSTELNVPFTGTKNWTPKDTAEIGKTDRLEAEADNGMRALGAAVMMSEQETPYGEYHRNKLIKLASAPTKLLHIGPTGQVIVDPPQHVIKPKPFADQEELKNFKADWKEKYRGNTLDAEGWTDDPEADSAADVLNQELVSEEYTDSLQDQIEQVSDEVDVLQGKVSTLLGQGVLSLIEEHREMAKMQSLLASQINRLTVVVKEHVDLHLDAHIYGMEKDLTKEPLLERMQARWERIKKFLKEN